MANRILRDWTCSETIDQLSEFGELFFTRLIMKADDFGRFYGSSKLLKAQLYPLKDYTLKQVEKWRDEVIKSGIVIIYKVEDKEYLEIKDFNQRLRLMKSKFPEPKNTLLSNDGQMTVNSQTNDGLKRNETETENEVETIPEKFSFRKSLCIYGFDEKLINEWLLVRKSKKSVNTETALNTFIKEVEKSNLPKNQILEMCVSNSWAGFKNEWLTNKNGNNGNTKTADERLQEAKSRILGEDSESSESKPNNENFEFTSYEDVGKF
jgi:hypothetical protein